MMFFYFLKIIFNISTLKRSKTYTTILNFSKKKKNQICWECRRSRVPKRSLSFILFLLQLLASCFLSFVMGFHTHCHIQFHETFPKEPFPSHPSSGHKEVNLRDRSLIRGLLGTNIGPLHKLGSVPGGAKL